MGTLTTLRKIAVVALLIGVMPVLGLNFIMPRLGIATENLDIQFSDLTISRLDLDNDEVTLDFWLRFGLPRRNANVPYYNDDGSVNTTNLKNPNAQVIIPRLKLDAKYKGALVGSGMSPAALVLDKDLPVEYLHLYLDCSLAPDAGLMMLFTGLVSGGLLESLLGSMMGDGGGDVGLSPDLLLADLDLVITAYMGAAPVRLEGLGGLLTGGLTPFPVLTGMPASSIAASASPYANPINRYNQTRDEGVSMMERLLSQLKGLDDPLTLVSGLIPGLDAILALVEGGDTGDVDLGELVGMLLGLITGSFGQLFDLDWLTPGADKRWELPLSTFGKLWINSSKQTGAAPFFDTDGLLADLKAAVDALGADPGMELPAQDVIDLKAAIDAGDRGAFDGILAAWAGTNETREDAITALNAQILAIQASYSQAVRIIAEQVVPAIDGFAGNESLQFTSANGTSAKNFLRDGNLAGYEALMLAWAGGNETRLNSFASLNASIQVQLDMIEEAEVRDIVAYGDMISASLLGLLSDGMFPGYVDDNEFLPVLVEADIINLFLVFSQAGYGISDLIAVLGQTVPSVLGLLLFSPQTETEYLEINGVQYDYGMEAPEALDAAIAVYGEGIDMFSLVILSIIAAFVVAFVLMSVTKGAVKINRREFLAREAVTANVKSFVSRVEQLGGKVSMQNAESLVIRAFRTEGKIDKPSDIERRAKTYVENQKLLVTLQSRASRAYVAQKFKDCIAAIEKMIQIARKLEDQTLVGNYEENLAKVVRLLRRKGISVSTKVRVDEAAKPTEELEQLNMYKKDLIDLQNKASKAFTEKNFAEAKGCIKEMLAIAKKIQDPVLIRNYEANLRKIIAMEKGGQP